MTEPAAPAAVRFKVVIPARYASSRLPGKPLLTIGNKPMIAHVCERALESGAEEVIVATDDERIRKAVDGIGLQAIMTAPDHTSGTERIAEVAQARGWGDDEIIVNLQGDEPLMQPLFISRTAGTLANQTSVGIATLAAPIRNPDEIFDPNAVKVILDTNSHALYFSRAPIPWDRETFSDGAVDPVATDFYLRHIGLYAYSVGFLKRYIQWPLSGLEKIECLEQLRILWQGERILVVRVENTPEAGIDTPGDLERVRNILGEKSDGPAFRKEGITKHPAGLLNSQIGS